jgi:serine/threonine-protein phosphatase 6 regulatory subunit 3
MFWECHVVTSSIDKLLDQSTDEVHLQEFLDEADLIQECLNQNQRLLDYLIQPTIMRELIQHIVTIPNDGNFRNAYIVSELLSGDFQRIQDTLLMREHLDLLYSFLLTNRNDPNEQSTLNPILASYFARIFITLIIRRPIEVINYLKSRATFKDDVIRHLDSTCITDILYRLIADAGEQRSLSIQWYEQIQFMDDLMTEFRQTQWTSVQINVGNLLSEFLRLAFDQPTTSEQDFAGPTLSATIERLLFNRNEFSQGEYRHVLTRAHRRFIVCLL